VPSAFLIYPEYVNVWENKLHEDNIKNIIAQPLILFRMLLYNLG
jgi:hypothetical protein